MNGSNKIITVPNLITVLRFFLLIPVILLFPDNTESSNLAILIIFIIAILSDSIDGIIARKFNQVSRIGKVLDPVVDKSFVAVAGILMVIYRDFPIWIILVVVGKDLLILAGGYFAKLKKGVVMSSVFIGKVTAFFTGITGILFFLNKSKIAYPFLYFTFGLILASLIVYFLNFIKVVKKH